MEMRQSRWNNEEHKSYRLWDRDGEPCECALMLRRWLEGNINTGEELYEFFTQIATRCARFEVEKYCSTIEMWSIFIALLFRASRSFFCINFFVFLWKILILSLQFSRGINLKFIWLLHRGGERHASPDWVHFLTFTVFATHSCAIKYKVETKDFEKLCESSWLNIKQIIWMLNVNFKDLTERSLFLCSA